MIQFAVTFLLTMILSFIALWILLMLREGFGAPDQRGLASQWASLAGTVGVICLPVSCGLLLWQMFGAHLREGNGAVIAGIILGAALPLAIMWRSVFLRRS